MSIELPVVPSHITRAQVRAAWEALGLGGDTFNRAISMSMDPRWIRVDLRHHLEGGGTWESNVTIPIKEES